MAPIVNKFNVQKRNVGETFKRSKIHAEKEFSKSYKYIEDLLALSRDIETKIYDNFNVVEESYGNFLSSHKLYLDSLYDESEIARERDNASTHSSKMCGLKQRISAWSNEEKLTTKFPHSLRSNDDISTSSCPTVMSTSFTDKNGHDSIKSRLKMLEENVQKLQMICKSLDTPAFNNRMVYDCVAFKPKIPIFTGVLDEYPFFIKTFDEFVGNSSLDEFIKLNILLQHCDGVAKECIEHFVLMNSGEGYLEARKMLKLRFGDPLILSHNLIMKLTNGEVITSQNSKDLHKLSIDMRGCSLRLLSLGVQNHLNKRDVLLKIVQRLSIEDQWEWASLAENMANDGHEPDFNDLIIFVDKICGIRSNIYGVNIIYPSKQPRKKVCDFCEGEHTFKQCKKFYALNIEEKHRFMFRTRRCYNCLQKGHVARGCLNKTRCPMCKGRHNQWFHLGASQEMLVKKNAPHCQNWRCC